MCHFVQWAFLFKSVLNVCVCGGRGGGQNIRLLFSVFSPGHFGILDRYPLCAFGVSADTLSACTCVHALALVWSVELITLLMQKHYSYLVFWLVSTIIITLICDCVCINQPFSTKVEFSAGAKVVNTLPFYAYISKSENPNNFRVESQKKS